VPVEPLSPDALVARLVAAVLDVAPAEPGGCTRVLLDGAPPTRPGDLADALVDPLRASGRPVVRVRAGDFLRPASVRLEHGRHDADALLDDWLDEGTVRREVLAPLGPGGSRRYLPTLWDAARDRATRAASAEAAAGTVLLLDGSLLLGRWADVELTVHLAVRHATLARTTGPDDAWTLPAYERYEAEVRPQDVADVVVRVDDPRHPAWVLPAAAPADGSMAP